MPSSARAELQAAVTGSLLLARGDRRGLGLFDASVDGFRRSFRAAAILYPLFLAMLPLRVTAAQWAAAGPTRIIVAETITYVIAWTAFPLLMLRVSGWFGRQHRFLPYIVVFNWSQLPQNALIAIFAVDRAAGILPTALGQLGELLATIAVLVYEWYIAKAALDVTGAQATLVVALYLVLGLALARAAQTLYQPGLLFGG